MLVVLSLCCVGTKKQVEIKCLLIDFERDFEGARAHKITNRTTKAFRAQTHTLLR